jgi:glutaminyl-peptide cyclotransferase
MIRFRIAVGLLAVINAIAQTPEYGYRIVHAYPHDPRAFTEGLEYRAGFLYESTGIKGASWLRREKLETGQVLQQFDLDSQYFGEGITILNQQITQLTWQTEIGFLYDQASFRLKRTFNYLGEGWSLTNDGTNIYMDDGTAQIRVWDPLTLQEKRRFTVRDHGQPVINLNELEWVNGQIYANIWQTYKIARISPTDGRVLGWIDLTGILSAAERTGGEDVLNGIAYDSLGDRLFVTGKYWPKLFEIKLVPKAQHSAQRKSR